MARWIMSYAIVWLYSSIATGSDLIDGDLRLVANNGSTLTSAGRLEIYYNGEWGTVCDDFFDNNENAANIACRQLGYIAASRYGDVEHLPYTEGTGQIWLDDVQCSSSETRLDSCAHLPFGMHGCVHAEDVALECSSNGCPSGERLFTCFDDNQLRLPDVICLNESQVCDGSNRDCSNGYDEDPLFCSMGSNGDLRLVANNGSTLTSAGRLEIYYNGEWGTVCVDSIDENKYLLDEANIACRQLGYVNVCRYGSVRDFSYNEGLGRIWLDDVQCSTSENRLEFCTHLPFGIHDCEHFEDVALECRSNAIIVAGQPPIGTIIGGVVGAIVTLLVIVGIIVIVVVALVLRNHHRPVLQKDATNFGGEKPLSVQLSNLPSAGISLPSAGIGLPESDQEGLYEDIEDQEHEELGNYNPADGYLDIISSLDTQQTAPHGEYVYSQCTAYVPNTIVSGDIGDSSDYENSSEAPTVQQVCSL